MVLFTGHVAMAIKLITGYIGYRLFVLSGREAEEGKGRNFTLSP